MPCPIHIYYCLVILVTISDILSTIMSPIYLVTLLDTYYTSCDNTVFLYTYILHFMYSVSGIPYTHCHYLITTLWYSYFEYFISTCSYSSRHHYAIVIIRLNKKYKVIKTYYMLLIHIDVIRNT